MRAKMYVYFFGFGAAGSVSSGSAPPETAQKYKLAMLQYGEKRLRYRSNRARSISLWR